MPSGGRSWMKTSLSLGSLLGASNCPPNQKREAIPSSVPCSSSSPSRGRMMEKGQRCFEPIEDMQRSSHRFPIARKLNWPLSVITLGLAVGAAFAGNTYVNNLGSGSAAAIGETRFQGLSIALFHCVLFTAFLAHWLRQEQSAIQRWVCFIAWGFGATILISYWGVLALPL